MKPYVAVAAILLTSTSAMGQAACKQAKATVQQQDGFTLHNVSLPVGDTSVQATAVVPGSDRPSSAVVFSFSTLVGEADKRIEVMSTAKELVRKGRAAIVIQRTLTWPTIDASVGKMQAVVLCAQQWLSAHAATKAGDWNFVGPAADMPTFDQLKAAGDASSMTFQWGFPLGGPNERNTEVVLTKGEFNIGMLPVTKQADGN
jgi:uncharacterized protein YdeI (BOF family)